MTFWYTIDNPRDRPCWEVNPKLWDHFCDAIEHLYGMRPQRNQLYTEQYVVQRMDMETVNEGWDGHEA